MKKIILIIVCLSIIPITKLMGKICVKDYVESPGSRAAAGRHSIWSE